MSELSEQIKDDYITGNGIGLIEVRHLIDEFEQLEAIIKEKDVLLEAANAKILELQEKYDRLNDFDNTQSAKLLAKVEKLTAEVEGFRKDIEDGTLLRLPCKKGDTVYWVENGKNIKKAIARQFGYEDESLWIIADVGKKVVVLNVTMLYFSQEEAEKAIVEKDNTDRPLTKKKLDLMFKCKEKALAEKGGHDGK